MAGAPCAQQAACRRAHTSQHRDMIMSRNALKQPAESYPFVVTPIDPFHLGLITTVLAVDEHELICLQAHTRFQLGLHPISCRGGPG